jgi:hypothetical protein
MTLGAQLRHAYAWAPLLLVVVLPVSAQTVVKCAKPPGEEVRCEAGQAAICEVREDGSVYGACRNVSQKTYQMMGGANGVYARELSRTLDRSITAQEAEDRSKFDSKLGALRWDYGKRTVTIALPKEWPSAAPAPK